MTKELFDYMRKVSRQTDKYTIEIINNLKSESRDIFEYSSHLPFLRNSSNQNNLIPKTRNTLASLIYQLFANENDADIKKIIPILSFIELSTCATYVLDDIIDKQTQRHTDKSTWSKYGISKGIIAGGIQTFIGFKALNYLEVDNEKKIKIYTLANDMWLKLWTGEGANEEMKEKTTLEEYINRCYNICGVMFEVAAKISAMIANANDSMIMSASDMGKNYGTAVMIRNDLTDVIRHFSKHSKALSKDPLEDFNKGVWTYPLRYAIEHSSPVDKKFLEERIGKTIGNTLKDVDKICKIVQTSGAIDATLNLIEEYKMLSQKSISLFPDSKYTRLLMALTNSLDNLKTYAQNHDNNA